MGFHVIFLLIGAVFLMLMESCLADFDYYLKKKHHKIHDTLKVKKFLWMKGDDVPYFSGKYTRFLRFAFSKETLNDTEVISFKKKIILYFTITMLSLSIFLFFTF